MKNWQEIKAEYLRGVAPREIAQKYGIRVKGLHEKASKEGWTKEKESLAKNIQEKVQRTIEDKITSLTDKALVVLEDILTDSEIKPEVKVQAVGKVLDISGLKFEKKELTTGSDLTIQVVKKEQE